MHYDGDCVYAQERAEAIARAIEQSEMEDICVYGKGSVCRRSSKSFNDVQDDLFLELDNDNYNGFNEYY